MNEHEIRLVKNRLDDYQAYRGLVRQAERRIDELQKLIQTAGCPRSPSLQKIAPTESPADPASLMNELISEQTDLLKNIRPYRKQMQEIEGYVNSFPDPVRKYMRMRYLEGMSYSEIQGRLFVSTSNIHMGISRALKSSSFERAKRIIEIVQIAQGEQC